MSEMRLEPPTSAPPPQPPQTPPPGAGSLAAGVGLAWAVMIVGEPLMLATRSLASFWLPPVVIVIWGVVLLNGHKTRTGKGLLLGLLSVIAVAILLVAACFGLFAISR